MSFVSGLRQADRGKIPQNRPCITNYNAIVVVWEAHASAQSLEKREKSVSAEKPEKCTQVFLRSLPKYHNDENNGPHHTLQESIKPAGLVRRG